MLNGLVALSTLCVHAQPLVWIYVQRPGCKFNRLVARSTTWLHISPPGCTFNTCLHSQPPGYTFNRLVAGSTVLLHVQPPGCTSNLLVVRSIPWSGCLLNSLVVFFFSLTVRKKQNNCLLCKSFAFFRKQINAKFCEKVKIIFMNFRIVIASFRKIQFLKKISYSETINNEYIERIYQMSS